MKINVSNIKKMINVNESTYDDQISYLIPQMIESICNYCNNDFIMYGINGYVYEAKDMLLEEYKIDIVTSLPILSDDFVRIYGTEYNDGLYQVTNYEDDEITIDFTKELRNESTNAIIALVNFPDIFINIIAKHVKSVIIMDGNVKSESIDDTKIEYFTQYNETDFINQNKLILNNYRSVFKRNYYELFNLGVGE